MQAGLSKALFDYAHFNNKKVNDYTESQKSQLETYENCIKRALCEFPNY